MSKFAKITNEDFLNLLASDSPAPGGGGAAAMAGALAAALSSMVGNLTIGKEKYAAQESVIRTLLDETILLRENLLKCVDEDAEVFEAFMSSYKLPKNTDEEKMVRSIAIRNAAKKAASIPLDIARVSFSVLKIAAEMAAIGNTNVITDATCSAILANAALRCATYNVFVNLNLTKDEKFNRAVINELEFIQKEADMLEKVVLNRTHEVIG